MKTIKLSVIAFLVLFILSYLVLPTRSTKNTRSFGLIKKPIEMGKTSYTVN